MSNVTSLMVNQINHDLADPEWCEKYGVESGHSIDSVDDFDALHVEYVWRKSSFEFTGYVTVADRIFRIDWELEKADDLPEETFDYWINYSKRPENA